MIDDFLASGATIRALVELVQHARRHAGGHRRGDREALRGCGREALADLGVPVETLACIVSMDNGRIVFDG